MENDAKLYGVTISVFYSDYLCEILPFNKNQLDYLVVVTTPEDKKTQKVCEFSGVHCVQTDAFYRNGNKFNKAAGINVGLENLPSDSEYVIHFDSDIVFPPHLLKSVKKLIKNGGIKPDWIYGADRVMINSYADWVEFKNEPQVQHVQDVFVLPPKYEPGVRIAKFEDGSDGFIPIGFFQMFNPMGANLKKPYYPPDHDTAARSDMKMALQYPRSKRGLIPELFVYHLATTTEMGINWNGRQTPFFGPAPTTHVKPHIIQVEDDFVSDLSQNYSFTPQLEPNFYS